MYEGKGFERVLTSYGVTWDEGDGIWNKRVLEMLPPGTKKKHIVGSRVEFCTLNSAGSP